MFCMYKMYLISTKGYEKAGVRLLTEKEIGIVWASMKNVQNGLGVQSMSDLVLKEIYSIIEQKTLRKSKLKNTK